MPFVSGLSSVLQVGAKTWRPKTADQQYHEAEKKRLAQEGERKKLEVQQKIETLEQVRKLEAKTQALNEMALAAEIQTKEHELAIRERQAAEARQLEFAKLELAKRMGRESLSEADLARIRRERMRAELLARAATNHAVRENHRPISGIDLGPQIRTPMPPPPPHLQPLPLPMPRPPSVISTPRVLSNPSPMMSHHGPPLGMPPLSHPPGHMPLPMSTPGLHPDMGLHRRAPSECSMRSRRMSDSFGPPPVGLGRGQWGLPSNALRGPGMPPTPSGHHDHHHHDHHDSSLRGRHIRTAPSEAMIAEMALRAQAEKLRRRRLQNLDLKARQLNLKAQALRDLRKRELVAQLRERGLQQREIEAQVRLLAERDRNKTEAQLRELRDRDHRLMLKEKGLQEREILEQIRRREEHDRDELRHELDKLERELRRQELLEAELSIKRAMEKGESPPLGILRPSMEEIESEGLLNDFWDEFNELDPRLRHEILSESGFSADYRPRTPAGAHPIGSHTPSMDRHGHGHTPSLDRHGHTPNLDRHGSRTPLNGHRTPLMRASSPGAALSANQAHERIRDEQMRVREENQMREEQLSRAPTPRTRDGHLSSQMTPQLRGDTMDRHGGRPGSTVGHPTPRVRGEEMLGDNLSQGQLPGRPRSASFDRRPGSVASRARGESCSREDVRSIVREGSRAAMREDMSTRERLREDLRAREETNRMGYDAPHRMMTPASSYHHRTPSMRDNLEPTYDHGGHHLDIPARSASRASSRAVDYDAVPRPLSRAGSMRDGYSPVQPRLSLPSRPSSRNLTAEDLGLNFGPNGRAPSREYERERVERAPPMGSALNDDILAARLQSAAVNSEINGGRRSRANSRVEPVDDDLLRGARGHYGAELGPGGANGGRHSRANSRTEPIDEDLMRGARGQYGAELGPGGANGGRRSRANSRTEPIDEDSMRGARGQYSAELGPGGANGGRRSRANSRAEPIDEDLMRGARGHYGAELGPGGANGGRRSRANSRAEPTDEDLLRSVRSQPTPEFGLGSSLGGRRSRANSRAEPPAEDLLRSASRNQLGAELPNVGGRRSRAGSVNHGHLGSSGRSPRGSEMGELGIQDEGFRGQGSRPGSRFGGEMGEGYRELGLSGMTNEELSRLSNDQLELLLAGGIPGAGFRNEPLFGLSHEEASRMTADEIEAYLAAHETDSLHGGIAGLEIGGSQGRLSRRPSRVGVDESPLFGGEQNYGPTSRNEPGSRASMHGSRAHQASDPRYEGRTGSGAGHSAMSSPNAPRSLYNMPGQYDVHAGEREGYWGGPEGGPSSSLVRRDAEVDLDEGEFIITERPEQPGARIIERLGMVEADSKNVVVGTLSGRHDGLSDGNEMHRAVKQLITEASRRGANGVVALRVSDLADGSYIASGEAVVLGQL